MNKNQINKKRTIPIRFNQNQAERYKTKNDQQYQNQQQSDHSQNNDNQQNQYMQSSYILKQSQQINVYSYKQREGVDLKEVSKKDFSSRNQEIKMVHHSNPYELTFKKQAMQNNEFSYQKENQSEGVQRTQQQQLQDSSESYQQVQYGKQTNRKVDQGQGMSTKSLLGCRQKLFQKYHSALVNCHYFQALGHKTIEQKHKQHLFELLVNQLRKNIFINGLKLNFIKASDKRKSLNNRYAPTPIQGKRTKEHCDQKYLDEQLLGKLQPKIVIFWQITYGIVKRKMFQCFDLILSLPTQISVQKNQQDSFDQNQGDSYSQEKGHNREGEQQISYDINQQQNSDDQYQKRKIYREIKQLKRRKEQPTCNKHHVSQSQNQNIKNLPQKKHSHHNPKQVDLEVSDQNPDQSDKADHDSQNNSQQNQDQENSESYQSQDELHKLRQLIQYIQNLKKQARQVDSQLKRYFIKWKIYLLQGILEDYQLQKYQQWDEHSESHLHTQKEDESQKIRQIQNQKNNQQDPINVYRRSRNNQVPIGSSTLRLQQMGNRTERIWSHQTSQNQQNNVQRSDLIKQNNRTLKSYLHQNYLNEFWDLFTQNYTNQKLLVISQRLRQQNLKKNALTGIRLNIQWKEKQRAMEQFYEQISQQQNLREIKAAELFSKTNIKTKYFFQLSRTCKNLKFIRKLDLLTLKLSFLKIFAHSQFRRKKKYNIERYLSIQNSKKVFKSFQAWKQSTVLSQSYIKVRKFNQRRNRQIEEYYFSVWQLIYKKSLIKLKKASNVHRKKVMAKTFWYLNFLSQQSLVLKSKQGQIRQYLFFNRGKQFYGNFYEFNGEQILSHRLKIKSQKLRVSKQKQLIYQKLQQWRNFIIKKQSYQAIQYRLVKLRHKQTKQKILKIWLNELDKRVNKRDELEQSTQHKDWLVKYYGSLCEIATSGKHFGE